MNNRFIKPNSYKQSKEIFINSLTRIKALQSGIVHTSFPVSGSDDLTIDLISSESTTLENLFILTTGLHGIEGYLGSIMMQLFMDEFLPSLDLAHTGILLVHCINPTGMQRSYRTNSENVDLNRNFVSDFFQMKESNPDYSKMKGFFNPHYPLQYESVTKIIFYFQILKWMIFAGPNRVRNAALMGQYDYPTGMYFGGQELQPETKIMMKIFHDWIPRYKNTLHLDIHTGYGPRSLMTLVQSSKETLTSKEAQELFKIPNVAASNSTEFYKMNGEMADFIYQLAQECDNQIYSAAFEFGTYGDGLFQEAKSLLTTIAANQLAQDKSSEFNWVKRDYQELYFPSENTWVVNAIENGRQGFAGILKAKGFIQ